MIKIGNCNRCGPVDLVQFVQHDASCGIVYTIDRNVHGLKKETFARPNPYATGYGRKIPTRYQVKFESGRDFIGPRWHRVYVMQYGNAGSAYILVRGVVMFLDSVTESRLEAL